MQTGVPLWTVVLCNDFSRGEIAQDRRLLVSTPGNGLDLIQIQLDFGIKLYWFWIELNRDIHLLWIE